MKSSSQPKKEKSDMIRNLLAGGLFALLALTTACSSSTPKPPAALQEDDPGWDCRTMGNRTCGNVLPIRPPGTICEDSAMTLNCTPPTPNHPDGYICHWEDNPTQPLGKEYICYDPDSKATITY